MLNSMFFFIFFFSSRRRHTRYWRDWSSDVCSSDLAGSRREPASGGGQGGPSSGGFRDAARVTAGVVGCRLDRRGGGGARCGGGQAARGGGDPPGRGGGRGRESTRPEPRSRQISDGRFCL